MYYETVMAGVDLSFKLASPTQMLYLITEDHPTTHTQANVFCPPKQ